MRTPKIPAFLSTQYGSSRKFRASHRKSLLATRKALDIARHGCAYTPSILKIQKIASLLDEAIEAARPKNWEGRK